MDIAAALNVQNLFDRGMAVSPWALTISDSGGSRPIGGEAAQSLGGALSIRPVGLDVQEDSRAFRWSGDAVVAIDGPSADMSRQLNNAFALQIEGRVDAIGTGPVLISVGGATLDATSLIRAQPLGKPVTVKIPLRCFADAGANFASLTNGLRIAASPGFGLTLRSVKAEAVGEPLACPPAAKPGA